MTTSVGSSDAPATSIYIDDDNDVDMPLSANTNANNDLTRQTVSGPAVSGISNDSISTSNTKVVSRRIIHEPSVKSRFPKLHEVHDIVRADNLPENVSREQLERIKKIHSQFYEGSQFSFNYNTLLLVASIIAGLGLASDSATTIIASMLVSPIMGPVVGMAYGATIYDWRLFRVALKTEIISLIVCILSGALIGLVTGTTALGSLWPTQEMFNRALWSNLFVGLPIAFVSGLGVAVGLLDEQTSSLVGVAISASLLPPAVNCGILWVAQLFKEADILGNDPMEITNPINPIPENLPEPPEENLPEVRRYLEGLNNYETHEFWLGGLISLLLTVSNIILIIFSSILMFRVKERLPIKKKVFWTDLGAARKIYRNLAYMEDEEEEFEATDQINDAGRANLIESKGVVEQNISSLNQQQADTLAESTMAAN
mmetsp:Transcript_31864/g.48483  ORF Transcript_31864/g.48483 Transcript_31864/m.48483 type:complete len:429 (+) Transcript_31864:29-1315(+)